MPRRRVLLLALLLPFAAVVRGQESGVPELEIVSRLGARSAVKLFDDEEVAFHARRRGSARAALLRDVRFVLLADPVVPGGRDDVLAETRDERRWGRPPSSFLFPPETRELEPGRYRLRALRKGFAPDEIRIVLARFGYHDLRAEREESSYRASFCLRLVDVTERRSAVPVEVRVEGLAGGLVDSRNVLLLPAPRDATFEGRGPVRLSSALGTPDRERPDGERTGTLRVVPGCSLVLVLDGVRFSWPVPLPADAEKGNVGGAGEWRGVRSPDDARAAGRDSR